jgi:hypothetical protein
MSREYGEPEKLQRLLYLMGDVAASLLFSKKPVTLRLLKPMPLMMKKQQHSQACSSRQNHSLSPQRKMMQHPGHHPPLHHPSATPG